MTTMMMLNDDDAEADDVALFLSLFLLGVHFFGGWCGHNYLPEDADADVNRMAKASISSNEQLQQQLRERERPFLFVYVLEGGVSLIMSFLGGWLCFSFKYSHHLIIIIISLSLFVSF